MCYVSIRVYYKLRSGATGIENVCQIIQPVAHVDCGLVAPFPSLAKQNTHYKLSLSIQH